MRSSVVVLLAFWTALVNAHFRTQFPPPRGPFNATAEVNFCDGYSSPALNRTPFPLNGGFVALNFSHGDKWTTGIYVSTSQNATKFDDFVLHGYKSGTKPGNYCLPLDFSKSNVTGLSDGQNITIQLQWNGGDGSLYQCSDVTLSSSLKISKTDVCQNSAATRTIVNSIIFLAALAALPGFLLL